MQKYQVINLGLPTKTCKCRDQKKAAGAGPGGTCVCPRCGAKVPHAAGQPCTDLTCPVCGNQMIRTSLSGPVGTSCVPGELRRQIEAEEETMRNEAARMERANDQAKDSYQSGDYAMVDRFTKISYESSRNWQGAKTKVAQLRLQLDQCEAQYRRPIETPSAFRRMVPNWNKTKASPPAYPPVTTPGSKPVGMRIPTFPFGSLFSSAGISPISMVSPMGPTGYSV